MGTGLDKNLSLSENITGPEITKSKPMLDLREIMCEGVD
jgi:hypothetical protein